MFLQEPPVRDKGGDRTEQEPLLLLRQRREQAQGSDLRLEGPAVVAGASVHVERRGDVHLVER